VPSPRISLELDGPNALWEGVSVGILDVTGSGVKNGSREVAMMGGGKGKDEGAGAVELEKRHG